MKIVAFLLVFFGILIAMRWWSAHQARKLAAKDDGDDVPRVTTTDKFVRCARCEAHIPQSTALLIDGQWKCVNSQCNERQS